MICFKSKLTDKHNYIKTTLLKNGYSEDILTITIRYKCMLFSTKLKFGPEIYPVYLKLPWIGNASMRLIEQTKRSVSYCFNSVKLWVVLKSNELFIFLKTMWPFIKKVSLFISFCANLTFATLVTLPKDWNLESTNTNLLLSLQII